MAAVAQAAPEDVATTPKATTATTATTAGAASAAAPELVRFNGRYRWVGGAQELRDLDAAIEAVVKKMNFLIRGYARGRIRKPNQPSPELRIEVERGRITIGRPGRPSITAPANAAPITWRESGGDTFQVSLGLEGAKLCQRFENSGSNTVNRFSLDESGQRLTIDTTVRAKRLPAPLHFQMTYQRQP